MLRLPSFGGFIVLGLSITPAAAAVPSLDLCGAKPSVSEQIDCVEPFLGAEATSASAISALEKVLEQDPAGVRRVAASEAERLPRDSEPMTRNLLLARLLTLEGRALLAMGRAPDAAEKLKAAANLDDGARRISWIHPDGKLGWTTPLDEGERRLEWAARGLLAAGQKEEARALLARALAMGASGWPEKYGWTMAGGGPVPGLDAAPSDLVVPRWFQPLPPLRFRLLDGDEFTLESARGKVLLLDFWASWCTPCMQELPHLKALAEALKERGLLAVAVNAEEPVGVVRAAVKSLDLKVQIGLYNSDVDRAFKIRTLPTLILADREGRIRARWDGYKPGLETTIAESTRLLLGDDPAGAARKVGVTTLGGGRLVARWSREFASSVGGATVIPVAGGRPKVAISAEGQLAILDGQGTIADRFRAPPSIGRFLPVDLNADGRFELLSYRPGGTEVTVFDLEQGIYRTWAARSPVLDIAMLAPASAAVPETKLVLATAAGVQLVDPGGIEAQPTEGPEPATSVAVAGVGGTQTIVALGGEGDLRWLDSVGKSLRKVSAPPGSWKLVKSGGGIGVVPEGVVGGVAGSFLGGQNRQIALATAAGQLVLVDADDGSVRLRISWPGINDLAAGDLDGDGKDDLVVAWDRSIAVLGLTAGGESTPAR